jgi:hypothetical protein
MSDGKEILPPAIEALYSMNHGRGNFNLFVRENNGKLASESTISRYTPRWTVCRSLEEDPLMRRRLRRQLLVISFKQSALDRSGARMGITGNPPTSRCGTSCTGRPSRIGPGAEAP